MNCLVTLLGQAQLNLLLFLKTHTLALWDWTRTVVLIFVIRAVSAYLVVSYQPLFRFSSFLLLLSIIFFRPSQLFFTSLSVFLVELTPQMIILTILFCFLKLISLFYSSPFIRCDQNAMGVQMIILKQLPLLPSQDGEVVIFFSSHSNYLFPQAFQEEQIYFSPNCQYCHGTWPIQLISSLLRQSQLITFLFF